MNNDRFYQMITALSIIRGNKLERDLEQMNEAVEEKDPRKMVTYMLWSIHDVPDDGMAKELIEQFVDIFVADNKTEDK